MKRDVDLVRRILLDLETKGSYTNWLDVDIEEYSPEQMDYHLELLTEAGLITMKGSAGGPARRYPVRLTWEGHEFLDAARDEAVWQAVRESIVEADDVPFGVIREMLLDAAAQRASNRLPLVE